MYDILVRIGLYAICIYHVHGIHMTSKFIYIVLYVYL